MFRIDQQITSLSSGGGAAYLPARPHGREEAQTLTCTSKNDVDLERVVGIRRASAAAVLSFADAVEHASPALGRTKRDRCLPRSPLRIHWAKPHLTT
jgi:hypothetical protein